MSGDHPRMLASGDCLRTPALAVAGLRGGEQGPPTDAVAVAASSDRLQMPVAMARATAKAMAGGGKQ